MDVDNNGCEKEWMWIRMDVKRMDLKKNGCG